MSGLATLASAHNRFGGATLFPWSARADHADLLAYVERARPNRIITFGRFAAEFAVELAARFKLEAVALHPTAQLPLRLATEPTV